MGDGKCPEGTRPRGRLAAVDACPYCVALRTAAGRARCAVPPVCRVAAAPAAPDSSTRAHPTFPFPFRTARQLRRSQAPGAVRPRRLPTVGSQFLSQFGHTGITDESDRYIGDNASDCGKEYDLCCMWTVKICETRAKFFLAASPNGVRVYRPESCGRRSSRRRLSRPDDDRRCPWTRRAATTGPGVGEGGLGLERFPSEPRIGRAPSFHLKARGILVRMLPSARRSSATHDRLTPLSRCVTLAPRGSTQRFG